MSLAPAPMPDDWPFRPDPERVRQTTEAEAATERVRHVSDGLHQAYRWTWARRPTAVGDWLRNPETGFVYSALVPWWRVPHFDAQAGDIKDVWEPARFAWAYDLARGWILTGDERFARALRDGINGFLQSAAPFHGPLWACGQETAIRAIAWLWAEGACSNAATLDDAWRKELLQALAWSAERITDAFAYAKSQRNNHGLSEATGLIAIGARLRGVDDRAMEWIKEGHRALEWMIRDQIAPDGWYIQHSFNYARVALDQLTVARRALRVAGRDLSPGAQERVRVLIELMAACIDPASGELPNHGPNDGGYVLPLSTRPYGDHRPSLTAAAATFGATLPDTVTPNAETLAWLREDAPRQHATPCAPWVRSGSSGWAVGATSRNRVFVRAGGYRSRPGHIDPGHVDLRIAGSPVAIDAGTYRYFASPPWNNGLAAIDVHNTVAITGLEPARRGPRFLWLTWPNARIDSAAVIDGQITIEITNDSWRDHGIVHRRRCTLGTDGALVIDEIIGRPDFVAPVHVHWLLNDDTNVHLEASETATVTEALGDAASTSGWAADSYGVKRPVRSVRLTAMPLEGRLRVTSSFGVVRQSRTMNRTATIDAEVPCST